MLTLYIHFMLSVTVAIKHFVKYFGLQRPGKRTYTVLKWSREDSNQFRFFSLYLVIIYLKSTIV